MAWGEIYRISGGGFVLDVQARVLRTLSTRMVVPLYPLEEASGAVMAKLNPILDLVDGQYVMWTQAMAAVPVRELSEAVADIPNGREGDVRAALDMLTESF